MIQRILQLTLNAVSRPWGGRCGPASAAVLLLVAVLAGCMEGLEPTASPTPPSTPVETPPPTATTPPHEIVLSAPTAGATVTSPVAVRGRVSVMPFEGTLRGRVYGAQGQVVGEKPIQAQSDVEGELGGPGAFAGTIPFELDAAGAGQVEVAEISMRDGSIVVSATVAVTLTMSVAARPDLTTPPGGWIAYRTPAGELALVSPDGSRRSPVTEEADVGSFAWSPDGRRLAFVQGQQLMLLSPEDGRVKALTPPGAIRSTELAWSQDGRHLAYLHRLAEGTEPVAPDALRVLEVDAGQAITISTYANTRPEEKAVTCPQPFSHPFLPVTSPWSRDLQIWDCRAGEALTELHTASDYCDYLWLPETQGIVFARQETAKPGIEWSCVENTQDCLKGEIKVSYPTSVNVWRMGEDAAGDGEPTVVMEGTQMQHYHPTCWLPDGRLEVQVKQFERTRYQGLAQPERVTYRYLEPTADGTLLEAEGGDLPWWAAGGFEERFEATDLYGERDGERAIIPGFAVGRDGETVVFAWSEQVNPEVWESAITVWRGEAEPVRLTAGSYPQWQPKTP